LSLRSIQEHLVYGLFAHSFINFTTLFNHFIDLSLLRNCKIISPIFLINSVQLSQVHLNNCFIVNWAILPQVKKKFLHTFYPANLTLQIPYQENGVIILLLSFQLLQFLIAFCSGFSCKLQGVVCNFIEYFKDFLHRSQGAIQLEEKEIAKILIVFNMIKPSDCLLKVLPIRLEPFYMLFCLWIDIAYEVGKEYSFSRSLLHLHFK
jgi:hypothetical protein